MRIIKGKNTLTIPVCTMLTETTDPPIIVLTREIDGAVHDVVVDNVHYFDCNRIAAVGIAAVDCTTADNLPTGRYNFEFKGKFNYKCLCWIQ